MPFRIRSVNWRDGMSLQQTDFQAERFSFDERLRWVASHATVDWGLIPSDAGFADPLAYEHSFTDRKLTIHVTRCVALTQDGAPIHVDSTAPEEGGGTPPLKAVYPLTAPAEKPREIHVVVEAAGSRTFEYGPLAVGEPPRPAWCYPDHRLLILDELPSGTTNLLEIGRFRVEGLEIMQMEAFVPPCMSMGSHRLLRERAEMLAGRFRDCSSSARTLANFVAEKRGRGQQPSSGDVAVERFGRELAMLADRALSRVVDCGPALPPRELVGVCREFIRCYRTLIETHPEVFNVSWKTHLRTEGSSIQVQDHDAFLREINSRMGGPVPHHPIMNALLPAFRIVDLIAKFPTKAAGWEGPPLRHPDSIADRIDYKGETYIKVDYRTIEHAVRGDGQYLDIRGVEPRNNGRFLILLTVKDPQQRKVSETLRVGGPDRQSLPFMARQAVDTTTFLQEKAVALLLDVAGGRNVDSLHLGVPKGDVDLTRISTVPGAEVKVYHRT